MFFSFSATKLRVDILFYLSISFSHILQRDVAVFFLRVLEHLALQNFQVLADDLPGVLRVDDFVDESSLRRHEWVGEPTCVFLRVLLDVLSSEDNLDGSFRSHHCDLGSGPRVVAVSSEVLAAHHIVCASVGFSCNHCDLGDGGFGVSVEEFRSVANNTSVLLVGSGKEAGHVDDRDDGNIECVAETNKASGLDGRVDVEAVFSERELLMLVY